MKSIPFLRIYIDIFKVEKRLNRFDFIIDFIIHTILSALLFLSAYFINSKFHLDYIPFLISYYIYSIPLTFMCIRRFNDIGLINKLALFSLIPIVGTLWILFISITYKQKEVYEAKYYTPHIQRFFVSFAVLFVILLSFSITSFVLFNNNYINADKTEYSFYHHGVRVYRSDRVLIRMEDVYEDEIYSNIPAEGAIIDDKIYIPLGLFEYEGYNIMVYCGKDDKTNKYELSFHYKKFEIGLFYNCRSYVTKDFDYKKYKCPLDIKDEDKQQYMIDLMNSVFDLSWLPL